MKDQMIKSLTTAIMATIGPEIDKLVDERDAARAKLYKLQEALTPSGETKAAYIGEFSFNIPDVDEDGNEVQRQVSVPWTTVKEIMAAILKRSGQAKLRIEETR